MAAGSRVAGFQGLEVRTSGVADLGFLELI